MPSATSYFLPLSKVKKAVIFNPLSTRHKPRIPNSLLAVAASIHGSHEYVMVDGNLENDPLSTITAYFESGQFAYFAVTVMPGPALKQAIPFSEFIKKKFPQTTVIWGGYFPSNHPAVCLKSGYVDYIVNGPGDKAFPQLLSALNNGLSLEGIPNLIRLGNNQQIVKHKTDELYDQDALPDLPYAYLNSFYPLTKYLPKTYLGQRTLSYHSSMGCPFTCSFCAVVPIYKARWKGQSAQRIFNAILPLIKEYKADALEFHDNNFFVSEKRTAEFARLIAPLKIKWWGEARIDTMDKYSDATLALLRDSGCKMIFFGAESGNDAVLKEMDKGGTQTAKQILSFAARLKRFNIVPEYSFVLGTPASSEKEVWKNILHDIAFIREVKKANPDTEIIIYTYSPVPTEGSEMYKQVQSAGFKYPEKLADWISPSWEKFDLRKNPLTPWLTPQMIDRIKNFETVLNGYYPTVSDVRMTKSQKSLIKKISSARYQFGIYHLPYEIKVFQKLWKYRQPEIEGF